MVALELLIALCAFWGLFLAFQNSAIPRRRALFVYYTNLSNALVGIYSLCLLLGGVSSPLRNPAPRLMLVTSITLTMLIYALVLSPEYRKKQAQGKPVDTKGADTYLLHYAVPILCILDWFFFAQKDGLSLSMVPLCLILPAAYCVFTLLRARLFGTLPGRHTAYPYSFLDAKARGWKGFLVSIFLIGLCVCALGCLFVEIPRLFPS